MEGFGCAEGRQAGSLCPESWIVPRLRSPCPPSAHLAFSAPLHPDCGQGTCMFFGAPRPDLHLALWRADTGWAPSVPQMWRWRMPASPSCRPSLPAKGRRARAGVEKQALCSWGASHCRMPSRSAGGGGGGGSCDLHGCDVDGSAGQSPRDLASKASVHLICLL